MPAKPRGKPWGHKKKPFQGFEQITTRKRKAGCCRGGPLAKFCKQCPKRPDDIKRERD